jgi:cyclophilin family peptidyl-prolyl cis-trans isomerase
MRWMLAFCLVGCGGSGETGDETESPLGTDTGTPAAASEALVVELQTSMGALSVELWPESSPLTVANFLTYVEDGFYDGSDGGSATTFHRVIDGFMIQGGGVDLNGAEKPTRSAIAIESNNGLSNDRGTIAMARTDDPNSATSQFYINHIDNAFLDYVDEANPGYAVFGQLVSGEDVLDSIAAVDTDAFDKPVSPVVIEQVTLTSGPDLEY